MKAGYQLLVDWGHSAARYLPAIILTAIVASGLVVAQTTVRSGFYLGEGGRILNARGYGWPACDVTRTQVGAYGYIPAGTVPTEVRSRWHGGGLAINVVASVMLLGATSVVGVRVGRRLLASPQYHLREILAGTAVVAVMIVLWQREAGIYALFGAEYPHTAHDTRSLPWYAALSIYLGVGCVVAVIWRGARWCGRRVRRSLSNA